MPVASGVASVPRQKPSGATIVGFSGAGGLASLTCVFRSIVTDRFGIVTAEFGNVTDRFGDVTDGVLKAA